jgi:uncharacterized protein YkwD
MTPKSRNYVLSLMTVAIALSLFSSPLARGRRNIATSTSADFLTPTEQELAAEINLLRSDPPKYAMYLEQSKKFYKGKDYKPPGQTMSLTTIEGVAAVDEAIKALRASKPLSTYTMSPGMCLAAKDHAKDLGRTGNSGHKGTDGSTVEMRVTRYGTFSNGIGENIYYESSGAREAVMGWLIDDGFPSRGHRRNLLSSNYRYLGVAVGDKSEAGLMCVLTFAGDFVEMKAGTATSKPKAVRKM